MKRRGPAFRAAQLEISMYDRIEDRSAQQAVRAKMEAAAQQDPLGERMSIAGLQQGPATPKAPLIDQEYQRLCEAISGLDAAVIELLERISPILQPEILSDTKNANGVISNPEPTPSEMRGKLIKARMWVESISAKIAPVRYTIEI